MFATMSTCQTLARTVRSLGGELPASLLRPLATYDALQQARRTMSAGTAQQVVTALINSPDEPTPDALAAVIDHAAIAHSREQVAREISEVAEKACVLHFRAALAGDGGEALTDSLRPGFDDAATGLREGMALISPGMTAEAAIEAGPETVAAWTAAPGVLSRLNSFAHYATMLHTEMDLVGSTAVFDHFSSRMVALFLDSDEADLTAAAVAYTQGGVAASGYRYGGWQSLVSGSGLALRLRSPREADALARAHAGRVTEGEAQGYAETHHELDEESTPRQRARQVTWVR